MVVLRPSTKWTAFLWRRSIRTARNPYLARSWSRAQRRSYSSDGGHGTQKASSDLPWLVGSIVVTVPSCAYILWPDESKKQGHDSHGEHAEHKERVDEAEAAEEGEGSEGAEEDEAVGGAEPAEEQPEPNSSAGQDITEGSAEEKQDANDVAVTQDDSQSDSGSAGGESHDTPDTSDDEAPQDEEHETGSGGNVEGVQFKGASKAGTGHGQDDTRKHIPDSKGYNKKRIESAYGVRQGVADKPEQDPKEGDLAAPSKTPGSMNSQSGKQAGLSNTDTKHSSDLDHNPEKSKKSEGGPDTAKTQGSIDPSRPQR